MSDVFNAELGKTVDEGEGGDDYLYWVGTLQGPEVWCQEAGMEPTRVTDWELWCDIRESRYNWTDDQRCNCSHWKNGCQNRQECNRGCDE